MLVFLARIGGDDPFVNLRVDDFERLAALDQFGEHALTDDPDKADVVLFTQCHMVDWRLRAVRDHPLARMYWDKVMVYDERDCPWLSFPGVYVGMPQRKFEKRSQRAWGYLTTPGVPTSSGDPDLLFSFVGSNTAPCRDLLLGLSHPDGLVEEVRGFMFWDESSPGFASRRARYQETLMRSRFVLCPRGRGTSSFRLYETLAAGRIPVIISDEWVAPRGPDWDACSLRWPEGRTRGLIELLEERESDWPTMSAEAARTSRDYFGTEVCFHRVVDLCDDLRSTGSKPPSPRQVHSRSVAAAVRERTRR